MIFDKVPKLHMKILLGDINAKVGTVVLKTNYWEREFNGEDNGSGEVNLATSEHLSVTGTNLLGRVLMGRRTMNY
jgi:hypothetical protein